ncbi:ribonuclease D [Aeromicrobium phragmitis]|uniref:Ribonuclease D n=1 Tax=Aeromicrobium phragmitis TaxID=2478914 RepID=A0A3L8PIS5_9ACTN|nr:HRDC domain-containing protein [Aeromicrobium phragmitis]RLV55316.1 ribonuclease D [Aeromicrobium phragmitis]
MTAPDAGATPDDAPEEAPLPRLGLREPLGDVIDDEDELARACAEISLAYGPIGLDAERASGYRYSQRAYLVQVRREGAGTFLIDPTAFDDLTDLGEAFGEAEWILHAATQDLPCLAEVGLRPTALFDTELAGRLLNLPRVGLAGLVEHYLHMSLAKEFSAADWSTRPLPEPWLEYAALDVEVLVELRNLVEADLERTGKLPWALEEFEALLTFTGPAERSEPWRRTSGIHKARGRRALAVVRSLWQTRDRIAQQRDVTPGRILPDSAILELAMSPPQDLSQLRASRPMRGRGPRRFLDEWHAAIEEALSLDEADLPSAGQRHDGPPPPRAWAEKNPAAAGRLQRAKAVVVELAEQYDLPSENLVSPGFIRQLAWEPPSVIDSDTVGEALTELGARRWQIGLVAGPVSQALRE